MWASSGIAPGGQSDRSRRRDTQAGARRRHAATRPQAERRDNADPPALFLRVDRRLSACGRVQEQPPAPPDLRCEDHGDAIRASVAETCLATKTTPASRTVRVPATRERAPPHSPCSAAEPLPWSATGRRRCPAATRRHGSRRPRSSIPAQQRCSTCADSKTKQPSARAGLWRPDPAQPDRP